MSEDSTEKEILDRAQSRLLANRSEFDKAASRNVARIQPVQAPGPRKYRCAGICGGYTEFPGVCKPCYDTERLRDHWLTMSSALKSIPEHYRWARPGAPLLLDRVPDLHTAMNNSNGPSWTWDSLLAERILVIYGETGAGKTSFACALLRHLIDATSPDSDNRILGRAQGAMFISARDIPVARGALELRPLAEQARGASVLLLDDVGQEAGNGDAYGAQERCRQVADLLDYVDAHDRQIIVTTYGSPKSWADRYGAGISRRYWESADVKILQLGRAA